MPRDSRSWRIRWPMFSTVSRFGHFSKSCRSSPGNSCGAGGGTRNSTFGGSMCRQRLQKSFLVRYCTKPHVLQRVTSRSSSFRLLLPLFSDTGAPHLFFWLAEGRNRPRGEDRNRRGGIVLGSPFRVKGFLENYWCYGHLPRSGIPKY